MRRRPDDPLLKALEESAALIENEQSAEMGQADDVFARYTGDEVNPRLSPRRHKEILRLRRDLRRLELSAAPPNAAQQLWRRLKELFQAESVGCSVASVGEKNA